MRFRPTGASSRVSTQHRTRGDWTSIERCTISGFPRRILRVMGASLNLVEYGMSYALKAPREAPKLPPTALLVRQRPAPPPCCSLQLDGAHNRLRFADKAVKGLP